MSASSKHRVPLLQLNNISAHWGQHVALLGVSLKLAAGERLALLGPNGGGKSTLLLVLAALHRHSGGQVLLDGEVAAPPSIRKQVGMAFQRSSLDDRLTIRENLFLHARLQGRTARAVRGRIQVLLSQLGIEAQAEVQVGKLSGGQHRRAELAKALLHHPRLLLLDEPTAGLDPAARKAFWHLLDTLHAESPFSVVVSTHLLDEAETCQQVAVLNQGRLTALGTPQQLRGAMQQHILSLKIVANKQDPFSKTSKTALQTAKKLLEEQMGCSVHIQAQDLKIAPFLPDRLHQLLQILNQASLKIDSLRLEHPFLEEALGLGHVPPSLSNADISGSRAASQTVKASLP